MRISRSGLLLGIVLAVAGCSDSPTGIARSASGAWVEAQQVPGSSLQVTLTSSGSTLSGTGTWSGEAFASGTVTATGSVSGSAVTLDLVLAATPGTSSLVIFDHFTGHLEAGRLVGVMTSGSPPNPASAVSVTFVRP